MSDFRVEFKELAWESPLPGLRFKVCRRDGKQIRLAEFSPEFVEPGWCEQGHAGYVLQGVLEIDFRGRKETFEAGDGLLIPPGPASGHKARALTEVASVILFEDLETGA